MAEPASILKPDTCEEKRRLDAAFMQAIQGVMEIHSQEFDALLRGEDTSRFDIALQTAQRKREQAKRELLRHLHQHGC